MRKPFALRAPVVVVVVLLIVGVIWFAGSKLNHIDREAALVTPTPTPAFASDFVAVNSGLKVGDVVWRNNQGHFEVFGTVHALNNEELIAILKPDFDVTEVSYDEFFKSGQYFLRRKSQETTPTPTPSLASSGAAFYNKRGWDFYQKRDYDKAISDYNEAIRLDPNYARAYNNRGIVYGDKKEYDKAISDFNEAITLNPNYAKAYYNRGVAYRKKGNNAQALTDFDSAKKLGYPPQ